MYSTVKETAIRWGISDRRVRALCAAGKIPGAYQVGRGWNIPSDLPKPHDGRVKSSALTAKELERKRIMINSMRALTSGEKERRDEEFAIEYIYNSEAIGGSSLSLRDTELIICGINIEDKPASEQHDVLLHKKALDYVYSSVALKRDLSETLIRQLHSFLLESKPEDRGEYRRVPVRIPGTAYKPSYPMSIKDDMAQVLYSYKKNADNFMEALARLHIGFESIHPFIDGNGRVGRLIVNFELMKAGYPPIVFRFIDRKKYYDAFSQYQATGKSTLMEELLYEALERSIDEFMSFSMSRTQRTDDMPEFMEKVAYEFKYDGVPVSCELFGNGHINKSYFVMTDRDRKYILQCINSVAFHDVPGLMDNAIAVSKHIAAKGGKSLHFIPTTDGRYWYVDGDGNYWRSYEHVEALCLQAVEKPDDFYESAVAFGTFQNMLNDFPAETLTETIPNFHNTPNRFSNLHKAVSEDGMRRVNQVLPEIEFALAREAEAGKLMDMLYTGELPLRVTHNDTKLNNVLLDKDTRKALCVIDLDTVMPGLSAFDFGDAIRFGASTAAEDEQDLSKVKVNLYLFRLFARGFIKSCPKLTENEKSVLVLGAKLMTLETGIRFLTDYLEGDRYFNISYPEQNLDRARTQLKLVADMEDHWKEMESIVREEADRFT